MKEAIKMSTETLVIGIIVGIIVVYIWNMRKDRKAEYGQIYNDFG